MKTRHVTLSPQASLSLRLFAGLIEEGRLRKGWTRDELAERVGVGVVTIRQIAKGSPRVAIGTYFEAATLVGVSLFTDDSDTLKREYTTQLERLSLLPKRAYRQPREPLDDDF
ncbi:helix-turn-helix transcriptional regulator [Halomonas sp. MCCC 1A11057]|jgi:transcriptional regulator with XRE-family HTH domain|uniref:helix-turn-helix domain-containing protein n=1 Tax=Halomonas sp. MCCC 1A11057 TaxID=2733482 RepID=UPI001F16C796|nr:helix-turn-helix transcriptional regulator [Halomonas sp. MCCC 1A11057]MCE8033722.1 helix-turn-helix transcriptional regulator [Halomonas sp. MCCC 1A11057]